VKWKIPEIEFESRICLRWLVTEKSVFLLQQFNHYKQNILPVSGGWLDQPNAFVCAVNTIKHHLAVCNTRGKG